MNRKRSMDYADTAASPLESKRRRSGEFRPQDYSPPPSQSFEEGVQTFVREDTPYRAHFTDDFVVPEIRLSVPDGSEEVLHRPATTLGYATQSVGTSGTSADRWNLLHPYPHHVPPPSSHRTASPMLPAQSSHNLAIWSNASGHSTSGATFLSYQNSRSSPTPLYAHADGTSAHVDVDMDAMPTHEQPWGCTQRRDCMCTLCCNLRLLAASGHAGSSESPYDNFASMLDGFSRISFSSSRDLEREHGRSLVRAEDMTHT